MLQLHNKTYSSTLTFSVNSQLSSFPLELFFNQAVIHNNSVCMSVGQRSHSHSYFNPNLTPKPNPYCPFIAYPSILKHEKNINPSPQFKCPLLVSCCCHKSIRTHTQTLWTSVSELLSGSLTSTLMIFAWRKERKAGEEERRSYTDKWLKNKDRITERKGKEVTESQICGFRGATKTYYSICNCVFSKYLPENPKTPFQSNFRALQSDTLTN